MHTTPRAASHVFDKVDRVAGSHDEGQRGHHAGEQIHRHAKEAKDAHRPHRTHEWWQAGDDRRSQAPRHDRRQHDGQAESERIEKQHVAAEGLGRLLAESRQAGDCECQHAGAVVSLRVGEEAFDPRHHLAEPRRLVGGSIQPGDDQDRGSVA